MWLKYEEPICSVLGSKMPNKVVIEEVEMRNGDAGVGRNIVKEERLHVWLRVEGGGGGRCPMLNTGNRITCWIPRGNYDSCVCNGRPSASIFSLLCNYLFPSFLPSPLRHHGSTLHYLSFSLVSYVLLLFHFIMFQFPYEVNLFTSIYHFVINSPFQML